MCYLPKKRVSEEGRLSFKLFKCLLSTPNPGYTLRVIIAPPHLHCHLTVLRVPRGRQRDVGEDTSSKEGLLVLQTWSENQIPRSHLPAALPGESGGGTRGLAVTYAKLVLLDSGLRK